MMVNVFDCPYSSYTRLKTNKRGTVLIFALKVLRNPHNRINDSPRLDVNV